MKATMVYTLLCAVAAITAIAEVLGDAPAPAPAPGLEALHMGFEIKNINYYDLTKVTCPKKPKMVNVNKDVKQDVKKVKGPKGKEPAKTLEAGSESPPAPKAAPGAGPKTAKGDVDVDKAIEEVHENSGHIQKQMSDSFQGFGKPEKGRKSGLPWMKKKEKQAQSLLQWGSCVEMKNSLETDSKECTTVMVVLRETIKRTVLNILECMMNAPAAPGPAPSIAPIVVSGAPAPAASVNGFLQSRNAGPAPAMLVPLPPAPAAAAAPDVKIFVTFSPGREIGSARTIMVDISFLDTPHNGVVDHTKAMPLLDHAVETGHFEEHIENAIQEVTGIKPKLAKKIELTKEVIRQWPVQECEKHVMALVKNFTLHYTRAQVPMALYNECTNFMTRISFSHDHVLDPLDTARCRKATAKFEKHWNYGEHGKEDDFEDICLKACEAKYGRNAPTCNVNEGDQLTSLPA